MYFPLVFWWTLILVCLSIVDIAPSLLVDEEGAHDHQNQGHGQTTHDQDVNWQEGHSAGVEDYSYKILYKYKYQGYK